MSIRRDEVNLTLTINGQSAGNTMREMRKEAADLRRQLDRMPIGGKEWAEASDRLRQIDGQIKAVKAAQSQVKEETDLWQKSMVKATLVVGVIAAAFRSMLGFANEASTAADEAAKQDAALKSRIISTNGAAGRSFEQLKQQAEELAKTTLFDDDQIKRGQELLLTFTNIGDTVYDETIPILGDLSTTMKQDISTSAVQVGKALNDPIQGISSLTRVGVTFSEEQKKLIKRLVETGDVAGAQRVILGELRKEFGGAAEAAAQAGRGPLQQLVKWFGEIKESIGGLINTFIARFSPAISGALKLLDGMVSGFNKLISVPVVEKLEQERQGFNGVALQILNANVGSSERTKLIGEMQRRYPQFLANINAEKATNEQLRPILDKINQSYIVRIALQKQQDKIQPLLEAEADAATALAEKRAKVNRELARAAELTGVNLAAFANEADQVAAVTKALEDKVASQGARFFATEEGKLLSRMRSASFIVDLASNQQVYSAKKVQDANAESAQVVEQLKKTYGSLVDDVLNENDPPPGVPAALAKDAEAAKGSLAFLREQISKIQKEIDNTPGDPKLLQPLVSKLKEAEAALKSLEARIEALKNPQVEVAPTLDQIAAQVGELGGGPEAQKSLQEQELLNLVGFNDAKMALQEEYIGDVSALLDRDAEKNVERWKKQLADEAEARKSMRELGQTAAEGAASLFIQIKQNQLQQETEAAQSALEKEYAAKIAAARGNSREQERLQKELEAKKQNIERKAASERKQIALSEAIIAGALAVVKALPNIFAATTAGLLAGIQIAKIANSKFAAGGFTGPGVGAPRDSTGHEPVGVVHAREWVSPRWMTEHPVYGRYVHALEGIRQRGFADGGFTTPTIATLPGASSSSESVSMGEFRALRNDFQLYAKNVEAWQSRLRVAYTDIEDRGSELGLVRTDAAL